jgi:poly(3-hydroxybutyrate) depolymerase
MGHRFFSAAACLLSLAASGIAQTNATLSFQVAGKTRSSVVHVPSGTNKPALVFFVHGANGSGAGFQNETKGNVTADREKFIAVYPSASSNGQGGIWEDMFGTGNFPFFLALIDTIDARYHIDRNKVYMTGFSQGGMISFVAACSYSHVFAAVAPVSGHSGTTCALKRPVPMFMTFGAQEGAPSFLKDLDVWLKADSCPSTPTITRPYPASNPNSKVTRVAYGPCANGSQVVMDSIKDQGHQWPGATNLNQADEVWSFFKQFSLGAATEVRSRRISEGHFPIAVSYSPGMIRIVGPGESHQISVTDIHGRLVASGTAAQGRFAFKNGPRGLYVASVSGSGGSAARKFVIP